MLDFKDWKKTKEDGKSVTMAHPKGHEMVILLKGIPALQKEALKRLPLAEGGELKLKEKAKKEKAAHYDEGTPDQPISSDDSDKQSQPPVTVNVNTPSAAATQAALPVQAQQPNVPSGSNVLLPNGSMNAPATAQSAQLANIEQQKIDAAKSKAMVPVEQARIQAEQQQAQQDQDRINALQIHADNLASNITKVDPKAYLKNMSAPAKVATGIGLFLGGFSVPFGGQNFAADFLNKNIERDVNAQIQNNENQKTIWGAYKELYGNQRAAHDMAKASMTDIYLGQARQIDQQLGTAQSKANLIKLSSDLATIKNKAILDAAGNLRSTPNNPERNLAPNKDINIRPAVAPGGPSEQKSFGPPEAEASSQKGLLKPDEYADSPILTPDSEQKLEDMQFGTHQDKANYPEALKQYTQAQQADTILNQLHEVHQNLYDEAKIGGTSGYLRRHDPSAAIPVVGHALSQLGIQPITDTQNNRAYERNKTRIVSDIANALRGTNVSGEDIQRIVDANTPEHGDTPQQVAEKERAIRVFIKNSVTKSLLKDKKMSK